MIPARAWWVRSAILSYAGSLAGVVLAAGVSSSVSVTLGGAAEAAAVLVVFDLVVLILLYGAARRPERLWGFPVALFVAAPALFLGGLFVAANVLPGFGVHGAWSYLLLLIATFGASQVVSSLANRVRPTGIEGA